MIFMKKLRNIIVACIFGLLVSCGTYYTPAKPDVEIQYGKMLNAYEGYYTIEQFDSICNVDGLNPRLEDWIIIPLKDGESKENITQYLYIKSLGENEAIYRVQDLGGNILKITKRITK